MNIIQTLRTCDAVLDVGVVTLQKVLRNMVRLSSFRVSIIHTRRSQHIYVQCTISLQRRKGLTTNTDSFLGVKGRTSSTCLAPTTIVGRKNHKKMASCMLPRS